MRSAGFYAAAVLLVLAAGFVVFDLAAQRPASSDISLTPEKTVLTFRHFWVEEHDRPMNEIFTETVARFEQAYPDIEIVMEGLPQQAHREQRLKAEMVTGNPPHLFLVFGGAELHPYVAAGRMMDLTGFLERSGLRDDFRDLSMWTFDGRVYGLPLEGFSEPLYYNRRLFEQLRLEPPRTWEDLLRVSDRLKEAGYIPLALGNRDRWPGAILYHYLLHRHGGQEQIDAIVQGEASFVNEAYVEASRKLVEMGRRGLFPDEVDQLDHDEGAVSLFIRGRAAMFLGGSWNANQFEQPRVSPDFEANVGVTLFPALREGMPQDIAAGFSMGIGVSSNLSPAEQTAVERFLEFVFTADVQRRIFEQALREPSMNILVDLSRVGPVFSDVMRVTRQAKGSFMAYDHLLPPAVKEAFYDASQALIIGLSDPHTELYRLQSVMEAWRRENGR